MNIRVALFTNLPPFMNDVPEVVRAFSPYIEIRESAEDKLGVFSIFHAEYVDLIIVNNKNAPIIKRKHIKLKTACSHDKNELLLLINNQECDDYLDKIYEASTNNSLKNDYHLFCNDYDFLDKDTVVSYNILAYKKRIKQFVKTELYLFCQGLTGINLPYGSLTGVRPTRPYYNLMAENRPAQQVLVDDFFVSPDRAKLISLVVDNQKGIYNTCDKAVSIYVNIPFCATRCSYCSFISTEIGKVKKQIPDYIKAVQLELTQIQQEIIQKGYTVRSIYVGGGTPTVLSGEQLFEMLQPLKDFACEFSVEAGRADSININRLDALKALNVNRISINPQTFNDDILKAIGRGHNREDIYNAYSLARKYPFDINMDLIAGLPNDYYDSFIDSLNQAIQLKPDNITIHTLSIKRGANIQTLGAQKLVNGDVRKMADHAIEQLINNNYLPYYMYRQKNMADNLENVGYTLKGKQCIYNIDFMEEVSTILSAGAGGVSKYITKGVNKISRKNNPKDINQYLASINERF